MWLNTVQHDHVARTFRVANDHELIFWPTNLLFAIFIDELLGPFLREVKKWIWVDVGNHQRIAFLQHPVECRCGYTTNIE